MRLALLHGSAMSPGKDILQDQEHYSRCEYAKCKIYRVPSRTILHIYKNTGAHKEVVVMEELLRLIQGTQTRIDVEGLFNTARKKNFHFTFKCF